MTWDELNKKYTETRDKNFFRKEGRYYEIL